MSSSSGDLPKDRLSLNKIRLNLKILSQLKDSDKLRINDNRNIVIDESGIFQGLTRTFMGGDREETIKIIKDLLNETFDMINRLIKNNRSDENVFEEKPAVIVQKLILDINNAVEGLENLRITYREDITTRAKLTLIIDELKTKTKILSNLLDL